MLGFGLHLNQSRTGGTAPPPTAPPSLSNPVVAEMATTVTSDLADDGMPWANACSPVVDQHGNVIVLFQKDGSGNKRHFYGWRNASGTAWIDNPATTGHDGQPGEAFFERGTFVYDATQSCIHTIWITTNPGDGGVIYRRYAVNRAGNDITSITRTPSVSVVLDGSNTAERYAHPLFLHFTDAAYGAHGALLGCWSVHTSGKNEIRAAMCVLGSSATTGGNAANWVAPAGASTDTLGIAPDVASYTALVANSNPGVCWPSLTRKVSGAHALDLYLLFHDGGNVPLSGNWRWLRASWNGTAHNWTGGFTSAALITPVQRAGTDAGYNLKEQLGSAWAEDTEHDRMVVGLATWKSNALGDTWGYVGVNSDDTLTALVDVYSAGGAHSFAPTGDVCYDSVSKRLVVSWLHTNNSAYVQLFDGLASAGDPLLVFNSQPVDIPLLYPRRAVQLLVLFRDRTIHGGGQRFHGWYGTVDWS